MLCDSIDNKHWLRGCVKISLVGNSCNAKNLVEKYDLFSRFSRKRCGILVFRLRRFFGDRGLYGMAAKTSEISPKLLHQRALNFL